LHEIQAGKEGSIFKLIVAFLLAGFLAEAAHAQSAAPNGGTRVDFESLNGSLNPESVFGYLYVPPGATAERKYGGVIVVHGSAGARDTREGDYGRGLSAAGFVVLVIDAFSPRGVASTAEDQARVTTGQMVRDAFAGLAYLAKHPLVDPRQVAVMGMSKGGSVALQAADPREQASARKRMGAGIFAAHVPLYPGCSTQYRNPKMTAPVLMLIGEEDDYTGVKSCSAYVDRIRAAGGKVEFKTYRGASHGFDGDTSTHRTFWVSTAQNFRDCEFFIEDDGRYVSRAGTVIDPKNVSASMQIARRECMRLGATVGANSSAKSQAFADISAFLKGNLKPGGDQR